MPKKMVDPWIQALVWVTLGHPVIWTEPPTHARWQITYTAAENRWAFRSEGGETFCSVVFPFAEWQDPRGAWDVVQQDAPFPYVHPLTPAPLPSGWEASPAASWAAAITTAGNAPIESDPTPFNNRYRMQRGPTGIWELMNWWEPAGDTTWKPLAYWSGAIVTLPWHVASPRIWNLTIAP